jgi:hypothetical protein
MQDQDVAPVPGHAQRGAHGFKRMLDQRVDLALQVARSLRRIKVQCAAEGVLAQRGLQRLVALAQRARAVGGLYHGLAVYRAGSAQHKRQHDPGAGPAPPHLPLP